LLDVWKKITERESGATFTERLAEFYDEMLTVWQAQVGGVKYCLACTGGWGQVLSGRHRWVGSSIVWQAQVGGVSSVSLSVRVGLHFMSLAVQLNQCYP